MNQNNIINEINQLISAKKFKEAIHLIKKNESLLKKEVNFFLQGLIKSENNRFEESILLYKKSIEINDQYLIPYLKLADTYDKLKKLIDSESCLKKALIINYNSDIIHNSLGYNLYKQNKLDDSILSFNKAIQINDNNYKACFNLANAFIKKNEYKKAILYYKKTIEINKNSPEVYFHLSEAYKILNEYDLAIHYLKVSLQENTTWLRREKIIAKILELYLITNNKKEYVNYINKLSISFPDNRRIAATSVFISNQFDHTNPHPFCPNPLDFIYKGSLKNYVDDYSVFLKSLMDEIDKLDFKWEPSGKTTRNGFGTTENLSEKKLLVFSQFEKCILNEVNKYYNNNKNNNAGYIRNWPINFKFQSWSNRLKKQGFNISHIHPTGWISGVFYLKIPKNIKGDEAGIEFSLHGDDYHIANIEKIKTSKLVPKEGDIIFFPSSLFHRTISFSSNEERVCIAFDLCKA
jgi:uncharacterized protein (TIGR02466 family)